MHNLEDLSIQQQLQQSRSRSLSFSAAKYIDIPSLNPAAPFALEKDQHISVLQPTMVKVFPEPVCPYANMHTLNPSKTDRIKGCVSRNTSSAKMPQNQVKKSRGR
jgi:hypothetical protein